MKDFIRNHKLLVTVCGAFILIVGNLIIFLHIQILNSAINTKDFLKYNHDIVKVEELNSAEYEGIRSLMTDLGFGWLNTRPKRYFLNVNGYTDSGGKLTEFILIPETDKKFGVLIPGEDSEGAIIDSKNNILDKLELKHYSSSLVGFVTKNIVLMRGTMTKNAITFETFQYNLETKEIRAVPTTDWRGTPFHKDLDDDSGVLLYDTGLAPGFYWDDHPAAESRIRYWSKLYPVGVDIMSFFNCHCSGNPIGNIYIADTHTFYFTGRNNEGVEKLYKVSIKP